MTHIQGIIKLYQQRIFLMIKRTLHIETSKILGQENKEKCMKILQQMKPLRLKGQMPEKHAAVLVPLCFVKGELSILYTVRSTNLRTNRGEVSFPGGMSEPDDKDLIHTAVRETEEELGVKCDTVDIWGQANFVGTYSGKVAVLPVIGFMGDIDIYNLNINEEEVATVFSMSLKQLCHPSVCRHTQFRSRSLVLPLFVGSEYKVWGLTAVITHLFLKALVPEHYTKKLKIIPSINRSNK